jgi:hypothetical protein
MGSFSELLSLIHEREIVIYIFYRLTVIRHALITAPHLGWNGSLS